MASKPVLEIVRSAKKPTGKKGTGGGAGSGSGKSEAVSFGNYSTNNGAFHRIKYVKSGGDSDGRLEFALCNFTCKITKIIIQDDGLVDTSFVRIEGRRNDGLLLPLVDVPMKEFMSSRSTWVSDAWGLKPYIETGATVRENLRAAIQLYSSLNGDVPSSTVYRYTGWKKLNDTWHYLTGSGAITAAGLVENVEVDLGSGNMKRYQLQAPLTGNELVTAAKSALLLLNICPENPHIGLILLAAVVRAPLGECQPTDFVIWLQGLTGSRKSELAAIALSFFGDFTARSFPSNWSDSVGQCETKAHRCKDSLFVVDDYKPSINPIEASKLKAMAERFIRNTGNQAGRDVMTSTNSPYNRSMTISTAEDTPPSQSLAGRMLIIEVNRSDVDNAVLTQLQNARKDGLFTGLMSAYLQFLAARMDKLKKEVPGYIEEYRAYAIRNKIATSHPRAPELYSNLSAAVNVFTDFLETIEGLEEPKRLMDIVETQLTKAFSQQNVYQTEQDEVEKFLNLLRAVLSTGCGHVACYITQGAPSEHPHAYGWRRENQDLTPKGELIGWYKNQIGKNQENESEIWLDQQAVFKAVQRFARDQSDPVLMQAPTLWRRLHEKGHIIKVDDKDAKSGRPRLTMQRKIVGIYKRVMILSASVIELKPEPKPESESES